MDYGNGWTAKSPEAPPGITPAEDVNTCARQLTKADDVDAMKKELIGMFPARYRA